MMLDTKTLNLAGAIYHGSFGLALYADGNAFADSGMSPVKYTADAEGPVGEFTARSGPTRDACARNFERTQRKTATARMTKAVALPALGPSSEGASCT